MKRFMITLLSLLPLFAAAQRGFKFASEMVTFSVDSTSDVLIQINARQAPDTRSRAVARIASLNPKVLSDNRYLVPSSSKLAKNEIEYTSQLYTDNHGGKTYVLPRIIASVKPDTDVIALLKSYPSVTLAERSGKIIKLDCAVTSSETVWKLVASLSKAEDMEWCEPDMLSEIQTCNALYDQQYYLKNRGQKGGKVSMDIHVEPAWEITNGEYVTVAVIDQGVDRDHEDMGGRVLEGYTVGDPAGKGTPQNPNKYKL